MFQLTQIEQFSASQQLSITEFKQKLYKTFSEASVSQKLKSQLRAHIIREIQNHSVLTTTNKSLLSKAVDSLIVEYMQAQGHEFSLSVFLPECGLGNVTQVCLFF